MTKQAHHFFGVERLAPQRKLFQQGAVIKPSPQEDEDKRRNEREDESFHEFGI